MTSPLDQPPVDTSAISATTEERDTARFSLSREMKILLGVLALGGAVGGWYVLSGAGAPAPDTAVSSPAGQASTDQTSAGQSSAAGQPSTTPPATDAGTGAVPGVTPGSGSVTDPNAATTPGAEVNSGANPVAVPQVPFLNPQGSSETAAPVTDAAPLGINPADTLAAVPDSNPFKPLTVVASTAPVTTTATTVTPTTSASTGATTATGSTPQNTIPSLNTAGAIPLPNVPVAGLGGSSSGGVTLSGGKSGTSTSGAGSTISSGLSSGGAIPLPNVPLGGVSTSTATIPGVPAQSPTVPAATTPAGTTATTGGQSGKTGSSTPTPATLPAAGTITPGLSAPSLGSLPLGTVSAPASTAAAPATGATTDAGTAAGSTTPAGTASTAAPSTAGVQPAPLNQPGLISQYGSANAPAAAPAVVVSPLDQLVQSRSLVFNAVVLGPINTAIFKTDKGFVVVPTGQTLPDSNVTLKEVTSTSATLSLGSDSKILELDKR